MSDQKSTAMGANRTGVQTSKIDSKELVQGVAKFQPKIEPTHATVLRAARTKTYAEAERIGSVPPPGSLKGMASTTLDLLKGQRGQTLIDKLGERLGFERTGSRLYETILLKYDAHGSWDGGPARADLERILVDERSHFLLLKQSMEELGADPTAMTPSADLAAVNSSGILKVVADPRTNLHQSLESILIAELTDNACWETLVELCRAMKHDQLAERFTHALAQEAQHLLMVKSWIAAAVGREAHATLASEEARP